MEFAYIQLIRCLYIIAALKLFSYATLIRAFNSKEFTEEFKKKFLNGSTNNTNRSLIEKLKYDAENNIFEENNDTLQSFEKNNIFQALTLANFSYSKSLLKNKNIFNNHYEKYKNLSAHIKSKSKLTLGKNNLYFSQI